MIHKLVHIRVRNEKCWICNRIDSKMVNVCKSYLKPSWNNTEKTRPNARCSCRGTTAYQSTDDSSREMSQKKALAISMIILMGSAATVNVNMASGGPKAKQAQPKKSITVIVSPRREIARVLVGVSPLSLHPRRSVGASKRQILSRFHEASSRLGRSPLTGAFIFPVWRTIGSSTDDRAGAFYKDTKAHGHRNQSPSHPCDNLWISPTTLPRGCRQHIDCPVDGTERSMFDISRV